LTGTYNLQALVFQPSAKIYALWEHEDGYTDSLGTVQVDRNFSTGRASAGAKLAYPTVWTETISLAPYAGLYGDYYFTSDDAASTGLASTPLLQGWSARATAGLDMKFNSGGLLSFGGELGGIGSNSHTTMWTYRVRGSVPF
jgi:outer membrane autotransporter protein